MINFKFNHMFTELKGYFIQMIISYNQLLFHFPTGHLNPSTKEIIDRSTFLAPNPLFTSAWVPTTDNPFPTKIFIFVDKIMFIRFLIKNQVLEQIWYTTDTPLVTQFSHSLSEALFTAQNWFTKGKFTVSFNGNSLFDWIIRHMINYRWSIIILILHVFSNWHFS